MSSKASKKIVRSTLKVLSRAADKSAHQERSIGWPFCFGLVYQPVHPSKQLHHSMEGSNRCSSSHQKTAVDK